MRGAPIGKHQIVRQIDQQRDRLLPRALQALLEPVRRCAVCHAPHHTAIKGGAAFRIVCANVYRACARAFKLGKSNRFERAQARRCQIAGNPVNAHAIRPVGRDRHVNYGRGAVIIGKALADARLGWKLDNPIVVIAQFQLARGAHHAVGFDPANGALTKLHSVRRHNCIGQAQHAFHTAARIGRAAHNLQRIAFSGRNGEHFELVRIGVLFCRKHFGHRKACEQLSRIFHPFHFQADSVQRVCDFSEGRLCFEVVFQPCERELHAPPPEERAPTPADSVG